MIPGVNARQARQMMQKMGIQQEDLDAREVIIRFEDKEIVISNPQVARINMMGQKTYQVAGQESIRSISSEPEISDDDIATVAQQASVSKEKALEAIKHHDGDLAAAIISLKNS